MNTYKNQSKLAKGDIIRVEYGDYDNWVTVIVDKVEDDDRYPRDSKIIGKFQSTGASVEMYGRKDEKVEVLGCLNYSGPDCDLGCNDTEEYYPEKWAVE